MTPERRKLVVTRHGVEVYAERMWAGFTDNERFGVSFGMFPAEKMEEAKAKGIDGHMLTVALLDLAAKSANQKGG